MPRKLISYAEFERQAGISKSTRKRLQKRDPRFPKPVPVTPYIKRLLQDESDAYLDELIAERDREHQAGR
jgi:predicted DNA-binding transcriptional regulator AlpA